MSARRLVAVFTLPIQREQARYTLDVYPEETTPGEIYCLFETAPHMAKWRMRRPITFRRSDGRQIVRRRDGKTSIGGWLLDMRGLASNGAATEGEGAP